MQIQSGFIRIQIVRYRNGKDTICLQRKLNKKTLKTEEVDRINLNTVGDNDVLIQLSAALDTAE